VAAEPIQEGKETGSSALPQIRLNDRIAIFGQTGTGKSILAHYLFKTTPVRLPTEKRPSGFWRICVDVTDTVFDDSLTFFDPAAVPWSESASLRFVPDVDTMEEQIDELYLQIMYHGNTWIWLDEANEVSTAHRTIPGLRRILLQGRKFQIGHAAVTPRPVDITKSIITQSEHLFLFPLIDLDDRTRIAKNVGLTQDEFDAEMARLEPYGYLWYSVRDKMMLSMPALPLEDVKKLE
jgi:hypothetical protein